MSNSETPWKFLRKWRNKRKIINREKYPRHGSIMGTDSPPTDILNDFVGYEKDGILCFYWGTGKRKFNRLGGYSQIFMYHRETYKNIKKWIDDNNYTGKVGFELCELEQLNRVVEYMLKRQGFKTRRDGDYLIIEY